MQLYAAVKLNSLVIKSSQTEGRGPKSIRLFKNTPSIGFGEAENAPAVQQFELTEKDLEGEPLTLRSASAGEERFEDIMPGNNPAAGCGQCHAQLLSSTISAICVSATANRSAPCRFVKFQSLTSLSIFVANNQGDEDSTRIQKIAIFGQSGETMNVADIKKAGEEDKQ